VRGGGVFELATSALLSPAGAGCEVELMFAGAPAAGANSDEVHDLVSLTRSGLLYDDAVASAGINLGLAQTVGEWRAGLRPATPLGRVVPHGCAPVTPTS